MDRRDRVFIFLSQGKINEVKILLEKSPDLAQENFCGSLLIHEACRIGSSEIVELLLRLGASVNSQTDIGSTPLHIVCQFGSVELLYLLVSRGALLTRKDDSGFSPLHVACFHRHDSVIRAIFLLASDATVQWLLRCRSRAGKSAFDVAAQRGAAACLQLLFKRHDGAFMPDLAEQAAANGHAEVLHLLVFVQQESFVPPDEEGDTEGGACPPSDAMPSLQSAQRLSGSGGSLKVRISTGGSASNRPLSVSGSWRMSAVRTKLPLTGGHREGDGVTVCGSCIEMAARAGYSECLAFFIIAVTASSERRALLLDVAEKNLEAQVEVDDDSSDDEDSSEVSSLASSSNWGGEDEMGSGICWPSTGPWSSPQLRRIPASFQLFVPPLQRSRALSLAVEAGQGLCLQMLRRCWPSCAPLDRRGALGDCLKLPPSRLVDTLRALTVPPLIFGTDELEAALEACVAGAKVEGLSVLLEAGGGDDTLLSTDTLSRALLHCARLGNVEMARVLLRAGAVAGFSEAGRDEHKDETPLFVAVRRDDAEMARLLLEAGAEGDQPGPLGVTPLGLAGQDGRQEMVRLLLSFHARQEAAGGLLRERLVRILQDVDVGRARQDLFAEAMRLVPVKVCLLGPPASGKTTLASLMRGADADIFQQNVATDGVAVHEHAGLSIWDFGGQELLFATHQFFLTEESQFVAVAALHRLREEAYERDVRYWLELCAEWCGVSSAPVLLVGTHADHVLPDTHALERALEDFGALARACGVRHLANDGRVTVLSTEDGGAGAQHALHTVLDQADRYIRKFRGLSSGDDEGTPVASSSEGSKKKNKRGKDKKKEKKKKSLQTRKKVKPLPLAWLDLAREVNEMRSMQPFLWWYEFLEMATRCRVPAEDVDNVARFLVNFGALLTYRMNSTGSPSLVVLDPAWLASAFTSIVSIRVVGDETRHGFYRREVLEERWTALSIERGTWPQLIRLFELFQMMVELPDGRYFVPAMLRAPADAAEGSAASAAAAAQQGQLAEDLIPEVSFNYGRQFRLTRIPEGLVDRLVVRLLHFPKVQLVAECSSAGDYLLRRCDSGGTGGGAVLVRLRVTYIGGHGGGLLSLECWAPWPTAVDEADATAAVLRRRRDLSFFLFFVFRSPEGLLSTYFRGKGDVDSTRVLFRGFDQGEERDVLRSALLRSKPPGEAARRSPDLHLAGIRFFDPGKIRLLRKLAAGAFGVAWLAELGASSSSPPLRVVVKQLHRTTDASFQEFMREAMFTAHVDGDCLVHLIGVSCLDDGQKPALIIEFAQYGDLTSCLDRVHGSGSLKLKLKLLRDVASALRDLHALKGPRLIHRDVRSQNVFVFSLGGDDVTAAPAAKLGDFGAMVIASPNYGEEIGNWQYMAPEAFRGALFVPYSQAIDVYSFAMVAWEIFSGKPPYVNYLMRADVARKKIVEGKRPKIPQSMPPALASLISRCWSNEPEQRPDFVSILECLDRERDLYFSRNASFVNSFALQKN